MTKYFSDKELSCKGTGEYKLAEGFGKRLDGLRDMMGMPITLTSAARSEEYNKKIGGHPRSLHVYDNPYHKTGGCCAVDIAAKTGFFKGELIASAWVMGFSVGVADGFVHIDDRTRVLDLPQVLYTY